MIVKGTIASDLREPLAQRAKVVRVAEDRGKWPDIRTNWVTRNKDVLQVTNRSSQPWLENNAALITIAADRLPEGQRVLLTYAWQPVTVSDLDRGPRLENYLVVIAEAGSFGADLLLPLHERFEQERSRVFRTSARSGPRYAGPSTSMRGTCRCRSSRSPTSAS